MNDYYNAYTIIHSELIHLIKSNDLLDKKQKAIVISEEVIREQLKVLKKLVDRATPKKLKEDYLGLHCSYCQTYDLDFFGNYCKHCGQAMELKDDEEKNKGEQE